MTAFWVLFGVVVALGIVLAILQDVATKRTIERLDRINIPAEKAAATDPRKDRNQPYYEG